MDLHDRYECLRVGKSKCTHALPNHVAAFRLQAAALRVRTTFAAGAEIRMIAACRRRRWQINVSRDFVGGYVHLFSR